MKKYVDYVLDACAVLALVRKERGGEIVRDFLQKSNYGEITLAMNIANLLEVYYDQLYESKEKAEYANNLIRNSCIKLIDSIDFVFDDAACFKTCYDISFADSFAIATAKILGATLITCDHEFEAISADEEVSFYYLRPKPEKQK